MAASQWKLFWLSLPHFFWPPSPPSLCGGGCRKGFHSSTLSLKVASRSCAREAGFLLAFLSPLLLLLMIFLIGSAKLAWSTQESVALQSRLDLCAVRLAVRRKALLENLVKSNAALKLTSLAIYVARGAKMAGPTGVVLGGASETALLKINRGLALEQEAELLSASASELRALQCPATPFSVVPARCAPFPPAASATRRERALFPDVKGTLVHRKQEKSVAYFRCWASQPRASAMLRVLGDARIEKSGYRDFYAE